MERNEVINRLPAHLLQYVLPQYYERYTPENQATWRYVMRQNVHYLRQVAHESYLAGLSLSGISVDTIPSMYGMNRILKDIGWAAVAVDGLIPTEAFLEFQAYNVLVIAADIRKLENIEYTPTPDIIHESAGHAPMIANPEYAEYLRRIGEIGSRAISSHAETRRFEAVRMLAALKENPASLPEEIARAQEAVDQVQGEVGEPSEMTHIKNLHWWTVEYGLIGTPEDPRIYGAGLLSSIGESKWCMSDQVTKISYDLEAAYQSFDVTRPQPQLYVTPDFAHLSYVLEQYANQMAMRTGGLAGVRKLIRSQKLGTVELSTGLQISGKFEKVVSHRDEVAYLSTAGPAALAFRDKELIGHGTGSYRGGFGSPIGRLQEINLAIEDMSPRDLEAYHIYEGRMVELEFEGGVKVQGKVVTGTRNRHGKIILITFSDCLVRLRDEILFSPDDGLYHMAVGKEVRSAYAGAADLDSFDLFTHQLSDSPHDIVDADVKQQDIYRALRALRQSAYNGGKLIEVASQIFEFVPGAWLLLLETYECAITHNESLAGECLDRLRKLAANNTKLTGLIEQGIGLVKVE